jgi:hypothetical protein
MKTSFAVLAVTLTASSLCHAAAVPEIDPSMGAGALVLLGGAIMVIRGRRKRQCPML